MSLTQDYHKLGAIKLEVYNEFVIHGTSEIITLKMSDFEDIIACVYKCKALEERVARLERNVQIEGSSVVTPKFETQ